MEIWIRYPRDFPAIWKESGISAHVVSTQGQVDWNKQNVNVDASSTSKKSNKNPFGRIFDRTGNIGIQRRHTESRAELSLSMEWIDGARIAELLDMKDRLKRYVSGHVTG